MKIASDGWGCEESGAAGAGELPRLPAVPAADLHAIRLQCAPGVLSYPVRDASGNLSGKADSNTLLPGSMGNPVKVTI